ncbi:hypothetical protein ACFORL_06275 [Legionella dresdenensis]|uniref:Bacteriocin-type signal sequence n=1 Tax=Legionella dresdenensis TaxID=450200 RepID=A0ABV8CEZ6_9GAMM
MEDNKRVLAYTLAKEISREELENVSGGSGQMGWCSRPTFRASGSNGSWDTVVDVVIDF